MEETDGELDGKSFLKTNSAGLRVSPLTEVVAVAGILLVFLGLQLVYPRLPGGAAWDAILEELYFAADILRFVQDGSFWRRFLDGTLPAGRYDYHGSLNAYLFAPVLSLFGPNWMLAKHWALPFALGTWILAYLLVRNLHGRVSAALTLLLLLIHPVFQMGTRIGHTMQNNMQFFCVAGLWALERWWSTKRPGFLAAGMFLFGLGMFTNLWFFWAWAGLLFCLIVFRRDVMDRFRGFSLVRFATVAAPGLAGLAAGLLPVIYRDLHSDFASLVRILREVFMQNDNPHGLGNYFGSLALSLNVFGEYLSGRFLYEKKIFKFDAVPDLVADFPPNAFYPWIVLSAVLYLLVRGAQGRESRRLLFLPVFFIGLVATSAVGRGVDIHSFFLYPFPQMILAIGIVAAFRRIRGIKAATAGLLLVLFATVALEARGLAVFFRQMVKTGGARIYSDEIYDMADWTAASVPPGTPMLVFSHLGEWYVRHMYFLLEGRDLNVVFIDGAYNPALGVHDPRRLARNFETRLREAGGSALLISDSDEPGVGICCKPFPILEWLRDHRVPHRTLKEFRDDDGYLLLRVYGIGPGYAAENRAEASSHVWTPRVGFGRKVS